MYRLQLEQYGVSLTIGSGAGAGVSGSSSGRAGAPKATRPSGRTVWQPTGMLGRCGGAGLSERGGAGVCVSLCTHTGVGVRAGVRARGAGVHVRARAPRSEHGVPVRDTLARE